MNYKINVEGEGRIVIKVVKLGGQVVLLEINKFLNLCLQE